MVTGHRKLPDDALSIREARRVDGFF